MKRIIKIKVKDRLDKNWKDCFDGLNIIYDGDDTILSGNIKDDAFMYGILNRIRDLNLKLISVNTREIKNQKNKNTMKKLILIIVGLAMFTTLAFSQNLIKTDTIPTPLEEQDFNRRHHLGSSLWVLANFLPDPAHYYQLDYGYQLTRKDVLLVNAVTWTYSEPIGTYGNSDEKYPGEIRAYGIGAGYQRFHWKNLFTTVQATPFLQEFYNADDEKIQKGFQLYLQFILGYRVEFFKKRMFIEPAYALKYWPVNTNFPASFAEIENGAPKHKIESSLNFGFRF